MRIVLDTNVLVSGLLNPFGPAASILQLVLGRDVSLIVDHRILLEYRDVLTRGKFRFSHAAVNALLEFIESTGEHVATKPLGASLPDPDDRPLIEAALAGAARTIVTWNAKHFPADACQDIRVLSPEAFLRHWHTTQR